MCGAKGCFNLIVHQGIKDNFTPAATVKVSNEFFLYLVVCSHVMKMAGKMQMNGDNEKNKHLNITK